MKQRNLRQEKGITLIALVITIIVMLILVAVTVSIAINGGLFNYAKQASSGYDTSRIKEEFQAGIYGLQMSYYQNAVEGSLRDYIFSNAGQALLKADLGENNLEYDAENNQITYKGIIFEIAENGEATIVGGTAIPETNNGGNDNENNNNVITPTITISPTTATIEIGSTTTLTATGVPGTIIWTSSDESVATVEDGIVTGLSDGTTTITATNEEGDAVSNYCRVNVFTPTITISPTTAIIEPGGTTTLTATGVSGTIIWTSSDENVATVENGLVTGISNGTTTITATNQSGTAISNSCTIKVITFGIIYPEGKDPEDVVLGDDITIGEERFLVIKNDQTKITAMPYYNITKTLTNPTQGDNGPSDIVVFSNSKYWSGAGKDIGMTGSNIQKYIEAYVNTLTNWGATGVTTRVPRLSDVNSLTNAQRNPGQTSDGYGYWLGTTSPDADGILVTVTRTGNVSYSVSYFSYYGVRPIVEIEI